MKTRNSEEKDPENNKSREVWLDDATLNEVSKTSNEEEEDDEYNKEEDEKEK